MKSPISSFPGSASMSKGPGMGDLLLFQGISSFPGSASMSQEGRQSLPAGIPRQSLGTRESGQFCF